MKIEFENNQRFCADSRGMHSGLVMTPLSRIQQLENRNLSEGYNFIQ